MKNKSIKILLVVTFLLITIGAVGLGVAYAQDPTPESPFTPGQMMGEWRQQSDYGWMDTMHKWMNQTGGIHTLVWENLADALGITLDDLNYELNNGKTVASLAEEKGVEYADLVTMLAGAHHDALESAVSDGILTQEQADDLLTQMAGRYEWMLDNMSSGTGYATGYRMMGGLGGMMGRFYNRQSSSDQFGPGGCHGYSTTSTSQNRP